MLHKSLGLSYEKLGGTDVKKINPKADDKPANEEILCDVDWQIHHKS